MLFLTVTLIFLQRDSIGMSITKEYLMKKFPETQNVNEKCFYGGKAKTRRNKVKLVKSQITPVIYSISNQKPRLTKLFSGVKNIFS